VREESKGEEKEGLDVEIAAQKNALRGFILPGITSL